VDVVDLYRESGETVLTWKQIRRHATESQLVAAIRSGRIASVGRGAYRLAHASVDYSRARQLHGTLSHLSAAKRWGITALREADQTHVTVSRARSKVNPPEDVRLFYRDIPADCIEGGVTDIVRTIVDCARDLPVPESLAIADSALRMNKVTPDQLVASAAGLRGPNSAKAKRIIGWADQRSDSVMESALRGVLYAAGFTSFEPQFAVKASDGALMHADLGDPRTRVLIEADSFLHHGEPWQLQADAQRYDEFVAAGYALLRFTWYQILDNQEWLLDMVDRVVRRTGQA
jgi:very-short-patch-repair endonuclease